jgi:DegV family protein with EDD domain
MDAARGNSGAIFAEFLQGVADDAAGRDVLHAEELARAFEAGERYARGALDKPQEGTILTVMTAVARRLRADVRQGHAALAELVATAVTTAREASLATRGQLAATARANVEDAGARGFALFIEGFADGLAGREEIPPAVVVVNEAAPPVMAEAHGPGDRRFCIECLVEGPTVDRRRLREAISPLGNSIVVAGGRERVRVHIHADDPALVFATVGRHGRISGEKADDMLRQSGSRAAAGGSVVVTDSAADLPLAMLDDLGIHMIPLRIQLADRTYLDKVGLSPQEFLRLLEETSEPPKTSQPAPGDFRRTYDYLASHFRHVLAITVSGRVSGTLQAARAAARYAAGRRGRITVIDSLNASLGQGLVARFAAEQARAGVDPEELEQSVHDAIGRTRTFGFVPDLRHAVRGGRLPRGIAWFSSVLGRRPVLELRAGRLGLAGLLRRFDDPVRPLARRILRKLDPTRPCRVAVAHAGRPEEATALLGELRAGLPRLEDSFATELGPALSVHGGPGTLVVAVQDR